MERGGRLGNISLLPTIVSTKSICIHIFFLPALFVLLSGDPLCLWRIFRRARFHILPTKRNVASTRLKRLESRIQFSETTPKERERKQIVENGGKRVRIQDFTVMVYMTKKPLKSVRKTVFLHFPQATIFH